MYHELRKEGTSSVIVQERIENERLTAAFGSGRRRIGSVILIEHAWLARGRLVVSIGLRRRGCLRRGVRRQVESTLASAAAKCERGRAQKDNGPSRTCRTVVTIHGKTPNAAAPYKDCPVLARAEQA